MLGLLLRQILISEAFDLFFGYRELGLKFLPPPPPSYINYCYYSIYGCLRFERVSVFGVFVRFFGVLGFFFFSGFFVFWVLGFFVSIVVIF